MPARDERWRVNLCPAFENRQGTKPREGYVGGSGRYGDLSGTDDGGEKGEGDRASWLRVRRRMSTWFLSCWALLSETESCVDW